MNDLKIKANSRHIRVHLLVNETAGNGNAKKANKAIQKVLTNLNIPFDQKKSHYSRELTLLARRYGDSYPTTQDVLIVIGGDGSFNEVLNGIKKSANPNLPIAYLPAGTGNDFARGAHLTKDPTKLVAHLLSKPSPEQVDCGYFCTKETSGYFVNNFGIGFDAFIVHQSNHERLKKELNHFHLGNFIYGLNLVKALAKQDNFIVSVKTSDKALHFEDAYFVTTTNHPYFGGGIAILPQASVHNHRLDTVIVEKPSWGKFILLFSKLLKDGSHVNASEFHYVEARKIIVETKKAEFAQIDGEDVNKQTFKIEFRISNFNLLK